MNGGPPGICSMQEKKYTKNKINLNYVVFILAILFISCVPEPSRDSFVRFPFIRILFPTSEGLTDSFEQTLANEVELSLIGLFSNYEEDSKRYAKLSLRLAMRNLGSSEEISFESKKVHAWYKNKELNFIDMTEPEIDLDSSDFLIELTFSTDTSYSSNSHDLIESETEINHPKIKIDLSQCIRIGGNYVVIDTIFAFPRKFR